ncbi:flavoprotein [Saccharothrix sp. NRRL B-16348]|uniref:flavoprotein n=1 Tax=Saccharothrix sp. NRRL B-16348 TaxID=1415542 RepID=UPI001E478297|nr:flavoprotein [Saccharothrix sp. NRRL B-16348]
MYIVAAAAPPVLRLHELIALLHVDGWRVCVIATPTAATWIDLPQLADRTGCLTRTTTQPPGHPQDALPHADAVIAAPITFNSINKWAAGISDSLALGVLNELISANIPIIAAPCVKPLLRQHPAYAPGVETLTATGVTVLDPDSIMARTDNGIATFHWTMITTVLRRTLQSSNPISS